MLRLLFFTFVFCLFSSCQSFEKKRLQAENYHQMAVSVLSKCNRPLALNHLLKGIKTNPKDFKIRNTLATVYFSLGDYEKAIYHFRKLLQSMPQVTQARLNLAHSYLKIKKYKQAFFEISRAEKDKAYDKPFKNYGA